MSDGVGISRGAGRYRGHLWHIFALVGAHAAMVTTAAGQLSNYQVQLVAPVATYSGLSPQLSINTTGLVAFTASDSADGFSKLFLSSCPVPPPLSEATVTLSSCPAPTPVSSLLSGGNRLFSGAAINNAATPTILSEDRASGSPPVWFLRSWKDTSPYSFLFVGKSPTTFGFATSFVGLADNGDSIAVVGAGTSLNPALQYFPAGTNSPLVPPVEGVIQEADFSSGILLRPQIAKATNTTVITNNLTNEVDTYDQMLAKPTFVAGASNGYSGIGTEPGISDDGTVVAFAATKSAISGIHVAVNIPPMPPLASSTTLLTPVVQVGVDGVSDLSASQTSRVSVLSRIGASFSNPIRNSLYYQLLTVAFSGTVAIGSGTALPGIYSRDVLVRVFYPTSGPPKAVVVGLSRISKIAAAGDSVGDTALSANFGLWDSGAFLTTGNATTTSADEQSPMFALTAQSSGAQIVAVRARRVCSIPRALPFDDKQGYPTAGNPSPETWSNILLSGSTSKTTIGVGGCQLTSATNMANYYASASVITPADANQILANHGFIKNGGHVCVPDSSPSCPVGPPQHLGFDGIPKGDVSLAGAVGLAALFGAPVSAGFRVDAVSPVDGNKKAPISNFPLLPNVNSNPLQPVVDFFTCNQEPIVIRVPNCNSSGTCDAHFVMAHGKDISGNDATEDINDPGNENDPSTNLYRTFSGRNRQNTVLGVRAITAASLPGTKPGEGGFRIQVNSPVSIVLTDPTGRHFGYDPSTLQSYSDIDNAELTDDGFTDPAGIAVASDARVIEIGGPSDAYGNVTGVGSGVVDGMYTLDVIGTATGPYTLSIQSTDSSGQTRTRYVAGNTSFGQHDTVYVTRSSVAGSSMTLATNTVTSRIPGDVLLHGIVDIDDVQAIVSAIGTPADGPDDPMDLNHDGQITALDARLEVLLCTNAGCVR